jgi:hypothetical protein
LITLQAIGRRIGLASRSNSVARVQFRDESDALLVIFASQFIRDFLEQRLHGLVGHAAAQLSIGRVFEAAPGRVGCRRGDAGLCECE